MPVRVPNFAKMFTARAAAEQAANAGPGIGVAIAQGVAGTLGQLTQEYSQNQQQKKLFQSFADSTDDPNTKRLYSAMAEGVPVFGKPSIDTASAFKGLLDANQQSQSFANQLELQKNSAIQQTELAKLKNGFDVAQLGAKNAQAFEMIKARNEGKAELYRLKAEADATQNEEERKIKYANLDLKTKEFQQKIGYQDDMIEIYKDRNNIAREKGIEQAKNAASKLQGLSKNQVEASIMLNPGWAPKWNQLKTQQSKAQAITDMDQRRIALEPINTQLQEIYRAAGTSLLQGREAAKSAPQGGGVTPPVGPPLGTSPYALPGAISVQSALEGIGPQVLNQSNLPLPDSGGGIDASLFDLGM